ncbi:hypothetical protein [Confluentibacter citreus]|uniref:hypothetical protein n=1 Tax=Confluentibacter citreus TaxID=2007307 RepID=UPI000C286041|nr:hypothetical protein [Confluentibacter citreus]
MKKVIENTKKGILMVAMLAASLSFANEGTPFFRLASNAKKTSLTLDYVKEGNTLYIKDSYGVKLYEELIIANGLYAKGFDLTALPDGSYHFELDAEVQIKVIPFTVESNTIKFDTDMANTIFKPTVRVKGDLVFVSKLALNNEPLKIEVYYEKGNSSELVLTETIKGTKNIERVYKLTDDLKSGDYKLVFTTSGREFTKFINN